MPWVNKPLKVCFQKMKKNAPMAIHFLKKIFSKKAPFGVHINLPMGHLSNPLFSKPSLFQIKKLKHFIPKD